LQLSSYPELKTAKIFGPKQKPKKQARKSSKGVLSESNKDLILIFDLMFVF